MNLVPGQMGDAMRSYTAIVSAPEGGNVFVTVFHGTISGESHTRDHTLVFCGKFGTRVFNMANRMSMLMSLALEYGAPMDEVIERLLGASHDGSGQHDAKSVPDAIGMALEAIEERRKADTQQAA